MLKRCFLGDLRRSAGLYILIAAVLIVMGVLTVNLSGNINSDLDARVVDYYDEDRFNDLAVWNPDGDLSFLDEDVEVVGRLKANYFDELSAWNYIILEYELADVYWLPLSDGKWFDGSAPQAIVPETMRGQYAIGDNIEIGDVGGNSVTATVIGYSENNGVINCGYRFYGEEEASPFILHNSNRIMICVDNIDRFVEAADGEDENIKYIMSMTAEEINYFKENGYRGLGLFLMSETFDNYLYRQQPFIALNIYMLYAMIAGCIVVAVTVSVSAGEVNRRRLGVTMLCGATRRNLMICEAIRGAVCAVIAIAVTAVLGTTFGESEMLKMAAEDIWKGVMAILATGAVICAAGVIRIAKTKILDLISGR